jgi:hypothetical protein
VAHNFDRLTRGTFLGPTARRKDSTDFLIGLSQVLAPTTLMNLSFTFGTAGRNSVWGPGLKKADLAMDRELPLIAALRLRLRIEAFNLFNTVNYGTPNRFVNTPQFGTITEAATAARQIQFVLRAMF